MLNHYQRFYHTSKALKYMSKTIPFLSKLEDLLPSKNDVERDIRDVSPPVSPLFRNRFASTGLFGEQGHQAAVHPVHLEASFASDDGMIHRMIWWLPYNDTWWSTYIPMVEWWWIWWEGEGEGEEKEGKGEGGGENDHTSRIILNKCIFFNHNMLRWAAQHFMAHLRPYQPCNETFTTSANESKSIILHHPEV